MIPLIDRDAHTRLLQRRHFMSDEGLRGVGNVFVPVGPNPNDSRPAPFRILYVGRALLREERELSRDDYDEAVSWSNAVIQKFLMTGRTPFWRFIKDIVKRTLREIGDDRVTTDLTDVLSKVVAWSNLTKISVSGGNPQGRILAMQADLCVELLNAEIELARPDAVICAVGGYADSEIAGPVFGTEGWIHDFPTKDQNAVKLDHPCGIPIVFTPHPQNMNGAGNLEKSRAFCTEVLVSALHARRQSG